MHNWVRVLCGASFVLMLGLFIGLMDTIGGHVDLSSPERFYMCVVLLLLFAGSIAVLVAGIA